MIWASSRIRNRPEQTFEVQTIGVPPENWGEVIRPGDPHKGQASTATKSGAKDSRRLAKSSRNTISPGAISESDDRFDICRLVGSCSDRQEPGTPCMPSRSVTAPGFRGLFCFATALKPFLPPSRENKTVPWLNPVNQQMLSSRRAVDFCSWHKARCPPVGLTRSHLERGAGRTWGGGHQTGIFVPIREKAQKTTIFRQNNCNSSGRPRRKSLVRCLL